MHTREEIFCAIFDRAKKLLKISDHIERVSYLICSRFSLSEEGIVHDMGGSDHFLMVNDHAVIIYSSVGLKWFSRHLFSYPTDNFDVDHFFYVWMQKDPLLFRSALGLLTQEISNGD